MALPAHQAIEVDALGADQNQLAVQNDATTAPTRLRAMPVLNRDSKLEPGLLAQTYVGRSRLSRPGSAVHRLVGERNPDIVLRFETNENVPASLVVMVMELKVLSVPA